MPATDDRPMSPQMADKRLLFGHPATPYAIQAYGMTHAHPRGIGHQRASYAVLRGFP